MNIKLFITGGTLDKVYNSRSGALEFDQSHVPQMLAQSRMTLEVTTEVLFLKDSLEFTEQDRELIVSKCRDCREKNIVISHGTDTMVETAQLLDKHIKDKTVALFGAMIPYSIKNSDALFNLGTALSAAKNKPGVYIAMNGQIFTSDTVQKNKQLGVFE